MMKQLLVTVFLWNCVHSTPSLPISYEESSKGDSPTDVEDNDVNSKRDFISSKEPESLDQRAVKFGTALGHKSGGGNSQYLSQLWKEYEKQFGSNMKRSLKKRAPFAFGTALGHQSKANEGNKYLTDLWNTYQSLFPEVSKRKRGVTFGTALGHDSDNGNQKDYQKALVAKYKELFGKRSRLREGREVDGNWYQVQKDSTEN